MPSARPVLAGCLTAAADTVSLPPSSSFGALIALLHTQAENLFGIYDPALGWFTQVNPVGVRLLGYPSEEAFLNDPDYSLRSPPWTPEQWQVLCEQARRENHQTVEAEIRRHTSEAFSAYLKPTFFQETGRATTDKGSYSLRLKSGTLITCPPDRHHAKPYRTSSSLCITIKPLGRYYSRF